MLKTAPLCLLSFLSLYVSSCGVTGRQILPNPSGDGQGSGSGNRPPYVPPTSFITATPTNFSDAFSKTVEEIGSHQEKITFTAVQDTVNNFTVDIHATNNSNDWTIAGIKKSDNTPCAIVNEPISLQAGDKCIATITFKPTALLNYNGKFNTTLTYSYLNNNGIDPKDEITISLLLKPFQALTSSTTSNLQQTQYPDLMSSLTLMYFTPSNSIVGSSFVGVTTANPNGGLSQNSLYTFNIDDKADDKSLKQIASNKLIDSFGTILNNQRSIFYKELSTKDNYLLPLSSSTSGNLIGSSIVNVTTDGKQIYGADQQGNVYKVDSNGRTTPFGTVISLPNGQISLNYAIAADITGNGNVYGLYSDNNSPNNYYLCKINSGSCQPLNGNIVPIKMNIIANYNNILTMLFSSSENSGLLTFMMFNSSLSPSNTFKTVSISADNFYPPVYDKTNNILYVTSIEGSTYTLSEIDLTSNTRSASHTFSTALGTISAPFLTAGTQSTQPNVAVVSARGDIYTFTNNNLANFNFANGSNIYSLPYAYTTTFYANAATIYNGNIFIPSYDLSTQAQINYLFQLNW